MKVYCTKKCGLNCWLCPFVYEKSFILVKNQYIFPLMVNADCMTRNIVYIILCTLCNVYYIGETEESLQKRMSGHFGTIKRFIPFVRMESEVAFHFNLKGHDLKKHFKVCVFKDLLITKKSRLSVEADLIYLFNEGYEAIVLNKKILSQNKIEQFCFY